MGRTLCTLAHSSDDLILSGATEWAGYDHLGQDVSLLTGSPAKTGVTLTSDVSSLDADVFVDFTRPQATLAALNALKGTGIKCAVIGTTGFTEDEMIALRASAGDMAIVFSGNFSLGVNMLSELVRQAAKSLGPDWDIEILETHHRHKVDAPSGTALLLGEAAADGRDAPLKELRLSPYDGVTGERPEGKIGFSVRRSGGVIGEHDVTFGSEEEILSLSHTALNRNVFARGALQAARWGAQQKPGFYSMKDVLGL
jgi:4-hydroxy-tetrahydrodipicolinate reductase